MSPLATTQLALPSSLAGPSALAAAFALPHSAFALPPPSNATADTAASLVKYWHANASGISGIGNLNWTTSDPFGGAHGGNESLRVHYPAGTRDGAQFSMNLFNTGAGGTGARTAAPVQTAVLSYEVAFDAEFDWVKGGKLPGLYGASPNATSICTGGNHQPDCFSARLMWRNRGLGEVYAYIPSYDGFCRQSDVLCNQEFGTSLSRGTFSFARGGWTRITQLVSLNTPGYANGLLVLYANDTLALAQTGLAYRVSSNVTLTSVLFSTFFGGSDASWDSTGGEAWFRNFAVWYGPNASNTTGPAVNATFSSSDSSSNSPSASSSSSSASATSTRHSRGHVTTPLHSATLLALLLAVLVLFA
ncbi:hypothetical protein JCM10908_006266 [Rhodotorula pacifica]|uniref:uncharacterized protein n=1 Tax=Rhodotorula pacifica TaxID=1495444 RepID=UPI00317F529D